MSEMKKEKGELIALLKKFQKGYQDRNPDVVEGFVKELFTENEDVLIIGTSAICFNDEEWCTSFEKATRIIKNHWIYWGDLRINIDEAQFLIEGKIAYVSTTGVLYENIKTESYYSYRLKLIEEKLKTPNTSSRLKLIDIIRGASDTLYETHKGEEYNWPIRLSMLLIKKRGRWKFKTIHFSYPVNSYPPVRLD
ncbi:hypothetical protein [Alkaliphilus peptidifermentans]|uniref:SnoaL-like domain-containing protein n=1 Tax=Alkaliphilus peptidifermentans DSM 18978 TaxID=1120976 RepID=A0A1G5D807_9FIRM|nr:hypothetical protein [Alkaliphilus peptidifermentans]SCY10560.1 hypothetical protein SAMN03080606_00820 [Alkaliphilus peptidifermentans DSM 18978]